MGFEGLGDLNAARAGLSQETPKPRRCDAGWIIVIRRSKTILAHRKSDRRRDLLHGVGRGAGVGRGLSVGCGRGVGVGEAVEGGVGVEVAVGVEVGVGVAVGVDVAVGVGVAVAP